MLRYSDSGRHSGSCSSWRSAVAERRSQWQLRRQSQTQRPQRLQQPLAREAARRLGTCCQHADRTGRQDWPTSQLWVPSVCLVSPPRQSALIGTHHHSSPLIITHHHSSPLIPTHHHSSSLITTHHHSSPLITTHHHSSPLITTHRYVLSLDPCRSHGRRLDRASGLLPSVVYWSTHVSS